MTLTSRFRIFATRSALMAAVLTGLALAPAPAGATSPPGFTFGDEPFRDYQCLSKRQIKKYFDYYGFSKVKVKRVRGDFAQVIGWSQGYYWLMKFERCEHEVPEMKIVDRHGNEPV